MVDFNTSKLTLEQEVFCSDIRKAYDVLDTALTQLVPDGRHKSLCITNLELSCMWAIKAIAHGDS